GAFAAPDLPASAVAALRAGMTRDVGVVRDAAGLSAQLGWIDAIEAVHGQALPLVAARLVTEAALARRESRGGHFRSDFPDTDPDAQHTRMVRTPLAAEEAA
ncbi:MAG TPA: L-aspartate oxidase, partial [Caulobacteraceae bacterium]|nr:L-aspartate oxidase [Caulobacteraceae bacterium]